MENTFKYVASVNTDTKCLSITIIACSFDEAASYIEPFLEDESYVTGEDYEILMVQQMAPIYEKVNNGLWSVDDGETLRFLRGWDVISAGAAS